MQDFISTWIARVQMSQDAWNIHWSYASCSSRTTQNLQLKNVQENHQRRKAKFWGLDPRDQKLCFKIWFRYVPRIPKTSKNVSKIQPHQQHENTEKWPRQKPKKRENSYLGEKWHTNLVSWLLHHVLLQATPNSSIKETLLPLPLFLALTQKLST